MDIGPEYSGDGSITSAKVYGESFCAVILRSHSGGIGSVRVTGGHLGLNGVDGAIVEPGSAGPFLLQVAAGQLCTLVGFYTIQLVQ